MNARDPAEIALNFVDCINRQDVEGLAALMTDDHTFVGYERGDRAQGRETMARGFAEYFTAFPDYRIHASKVLRSGDDIAIIGTTTGSHVAPELEARETLIWTARIERGLVAEWRIYTDLEQIRAGGQGE
jgi:uncharacterized protein (TIGR02246 family)